MKSLRIGLLLFGLNALVLSTAQAVVFVNVHRDAYIEDFTRDQNIPPDGTPDAIHDTNALIASRGEFFDDFNAFNVDSHAIMTFSIAPYAGQTLLSAFLEGFGTRVDNRGSLDPITGQFYMYSGDGLVGLNDFNNPNPAIFIGDVSFQANPQGFNLELFQLDITTHLQNMLTDSRDFAEFRVESELASVFINAGEVGPNSGFQLDTRWPGPRLVLTFAQESATVPEPATGVLMAGGLAFGFLRKKKNGRG